MAGEALFRMPASPVVAQHRLRLQARVMCKLLPVPLTFHTPPTPTKPTSFAVVSFIEPTTCARVNVCPQVELGIVGQPEDDAASPLPTVASNAPLLRQEDKNPPRQLRNDIACTSNGCARATGHFLLGIGGASTVAGPCAVPPLCAVAFVPSGHA